MVPPHATQPGETAVVLSYYWAFFQMGGCFFIVCGDGYGDGLAGAESGKSEGDYCDEFEEVHCLCLPLSSEVV